MLPIHEHEETLLNAVRAHQILLVVGETGSGKTTQLPQFLWLDRRKAQTTDRPLKIAVTQPRRVAAISVATRVAEEIRCALGSTVREKGAAP